MLIAGDATLDDRARALPVDKVDKVLREKGFARPMVQIRLINIYQYVY